MESDVKTLAEKDLWGLWGKIKRLLLVGSAALLMALTLKTFVYAGGLLPGGFVGLTILIQHAALQFLHLKLPFSPVNFILNFVPALISLKFIGRRFTLYSVLMIILVGIFTDMLPHFPVTDDILLSAVFGGLINSVSISLCLFAGATSGGTDFIAIFISEKYGRDAWNYIFLGNIVVLTVAGALFGWEKALYSILFQFTTTQGLNYLYRRYQKVTIFIITNKTDEVFTIIKNRTNHGATIFHGEGCYNRAPRDLLYSVVAGDEVRQLIPQIKNADPDAFINVVHSKQILGRFYVRPND